MIFNRNISMAEPLPARDARRYFADDTRVICDISGCAYLVCRVELQVGDPQALAEILADALNRIPMLAA